LTASALRLAEPDNRGALVAKGTDVADVNVAPETVDRALAFLDSLIQAAEASGHTIAKGTEPAMLLVNGTPVPMTISERFYRDTTPADAQELKRRHEYERKYPRFFRRQDLNDGWTHRPSGKLTIILSNGHIAGLPSRWTDLATHPIEGRIEQVIEAASEHAEVIKERQRRVDERMAERRARDDQQRRDESERDLLQQRTAFLVDRVQTFDLISRIERYVKHIRDDESWYPTPRAAQFMQFAEEHIAALRLASDAPALEKDLASSNLW